MDPLEAPEPLALINRQDPENFSSGPTLAPADALYEEDSTDWEDELAEAFFTTLEPAPERMVHDEELPIVGRSPIPGLLFATLGVVVVGAALAVAVVAAFPVRTTSPPPVAEVPAPVLDAIVLPAHGTIVDIGATEGDAPRRQSWRARRRAAKPAPMRVDALQPAVSVMDLPPAE